MGIALDPEALASLLALSGDEPDVVGGVVDRFLEDTRRWLRTMRRAIEVNSADDLLRSARGIRGAAMTVGAVALSGACAPIEELAVRGDVDGAAGWIPRLEAAYSDAVAAIEEARELGWDLEWDLE